MRHNEEMSAPTQYCLLCDQPINTDSPFCGACGVNRAAPPCPNCGLPVTSQRDRREGADIIGWNKDWSGACGFCGQEFRSKISVETPGGLQPETGTVAIEPRESLLDGLDFTDVVPTLQIRIERKHAAANTPEEGGLRTAESINLTAVEWLAIRKELDGILQPLLLRRVSRIDRT